MTNDWIFVMDRLPDTSREVLAVDGDMNRAVARYFNEHDWGWDSDNVVFCTQNVVAWREIEMNEEITPDELNNELRFRHLEWKIAENELQACRTERDQLRSEIERLTRANNICSAIRDGLYGQVEELIKERDALIHQLDKDEHLREANLKMARATKAQLIAASNERDSLRKTVESLAKEHNTARRVAQHWYDMYMRLNRKLGSEGLDKNERG